MARVLDIAKRVHDHTWKLDPIIRSLLDTDFYKLMMLQMIWKMHRDVDATFSLINRKASIRLADEIDEGELRAQLDHARTVRLAKKEMIWLAGNTFYGRAQIFDPEFLAWFEDFRLPDYELSVRDGQFELNFHGPWVETTMWEIPALAIINELRSRAAMRGLGPFELDVLYARAKAKMWHKVERLKQLEGLRISDFGTRRRHSFLWQRWCVQALAEGIPDAFTGTSNVLLAMDNDLEAVGTNAHELPMVYAALAQTDEGIAAANYRVLEDWNKLYGGNLLIVLPDTFGTAAFLNDAPDWVADWTGFRPDSAPPVEGGERIIEWWREQTARPARQDPDLLRRARRRHDHRDLQPFFRAGAHGVRLGHQPDQRLRRLRAAPQRPAAGDFAGLQGDRRQRASGRQAVGQSEQGNWRGTSEIQRYLSLFGSEERVKKPVLV